MLPFFVAAAVWIVQRTILIDIDSGMYLENDPFRTATYPLFLDLFVGPTLLPIQLLLFASAVAWLAHYCQRYLPWGVAGLLIVALLANPYVWQLQASILTEALAIPILTVIVGLFISFSAKPSAKCMLAIAALGGLATTIRPPILPFIVAPIAAIWLVQRFDGRTKLSALVILFWFIPIAVERIYSHAIHGDRITSGMGRSIFMKAAMIGAPETPPSSDDPLDLRLADALNKDYEPVRQLIARTRAPQMRFILTSNYETCAGYGYCTQILFRETDRSEAELERHLKAASVPRLLANPAGYLALNAQDYLKVWLLHPRKVPALAKQYNELLERETPIPFAVQLEEYGRPTPMGEQSSFLILNRVGFAVIGLFAAMLTMLLTFYRPNPLAQTAFVLLLGLQAVLAVGSFVATGLPRYPMGLWPLIVGGELLGFVSLLAFTLRDRFGRWPSCQQSSHSFGRPLQS